MDHCARSIQGYLTSTWFLISNTKLTNKRLQGVLKLLFTYSWEEDQDKKRVAAKNHPSDYHFFYLPRSTPKLQKILLDQNLMPDLENLKNCKNWRDFIKFYVQFNEENPEDIFDPLRQYAVNRTKFPSTSSNGQSVFNWNFYPTLLQSYMSRYVDFSIFHY
jgi:hypothetical protein